MAIPQQCSRHRCYRTADLDANYPLDHPLCKPHRAGQKRRIENDAKRRAERDVLLRRNAREQAQRAYADAWRRAHPEQHYSPPRQCPLCAKQIQSTADQVGDGPFDAYGPARGVYEAHVAEHGSAWIEYQSAGVE